MRAKLIAEKKAQEQRRQKIYLAHLSSIYGIAGALPTTPRQNQNQRRSSPPKRKPGLAEAVKPSQERAQWKQMPAAKRERHQQAEVQLMIGNLSDMVKSCVFGCFGSSCMCLS